MPDPGFEGMAATARIPVTRVISDMESPRLRACRLRYGPMKPCPVKEDV